MFSDIDVQIDTKMVHIPEITFIIAESKSKVMVMVMQELEPDEGAEDGFQMVCAKHHLGSTLHGN